MVKDVCVTEQLKPEREGSSRQAPELHYSLLYEPQCAELRVGLLQGKGTALSRAWACCKVRAQRRAMHGPAAR